MGLGIPLVWHSRSYFFCWLKITSIYDYKWWFWCVIKRLIQWYKGIHTKFSNHFIMWNPIYFISHLIVITWLQVIYIRIRITTTVICFLVRGACLFGFFFNMDEWHTTKNTRRQIHTFKGNHFFSESLQWRLKIISARMDLIYDIFCHSKSLSPIRQLYMSL